ncbi:hypothetical protein F183_A50440 [Bryobacterales bacterium F-183]|nr:hypothetical protein F183_A50440 [Bryobacterales bacterium F-183]
MRRYLRQAWRQAFLQQRGFSAIVILTIGLTVGAAASVFSLFDAAMLRPFPYPQPDRLVRLESYLTTDRDSWQSVSLYDFEDFAKRSTSFTSLGAYTTYTNPLTSGSGPAQPVRMTFATPGLFDALGVKPAVGRFYTRAEDAIGGAVRKAVISHGLWQSLFGNSQTALGSTIQLRGQSFEVIGIMPPGMDFPSRTQVWVPLYARYATYKDDWWKRRDAREHQVTGRLHDGVSVEQANQEVKAIAAGLRAEHPEQNRNAEARIISFRDAETSGARPYLYLVAGAALLLLLLGCVNVANLMVARAASRERDIVIRRALGAGLWPLTAQLLTEALLLSTLGAILGLGLAYLGIQIFPLFLPEDTPTWLKLELNPNLIAFAVATSALTATLAALLPALHQTRANVNDVLKQSSKGSEGHTFAAWIRPILVAGEIAIALILLAGAGLMIRSFQTALGMDHGLDAEKLVVVDTGYFVPDVAKEAAVRAYSDSYRRVQLEIGALPGVVSVSGGSIVPFVNQTEARPASELYTLRRSTRDQAFRLPFQGSDVMPGFFATLGVPLLDGRDFTENDTFGSQSVVIISQRLASALFPNEQAVGQRIRYGNNQSYDPWSTVIGVVGNVRYHAAENTPGYEMYWPYRQYPGPGMRFVVRTREDASAIVPRIREAIRSANPGMAINRTVEMTDLIGESIWRRRLWGAILSVFAGVALLLASVGIYGVMSFLVSRQKKEIGIRLAIGASPGTVARWALARGLRLALAGLAVGILLAAFASTALLRPLVFGIPAHDPVVFISISAVLLGVALVACLGPALRASRIDPVIALRDS